MAGRASLWKVVCEVNGKVKCTDISIPSTDFKAGKMNLLRLGNTNSLNISIQQTVGHRPSSKRTIHLKQHRFKLSMRPTKLTVTFGYNKTSLSIVEANENELKILIDLLHSFNEGKFAEHKEIKSRPNQRAELSGNYQQVGILANDENQPLNSNVQKNTTSPVQSSEANQFLSTKPDHSHTPSRLESTTHLGVKRRHTPFSSRSSFYGPRISSPSVLVNKPFVSPLQEKSSTTDKSSVKTSSFYGTDSPAPQGRKVIGLPKNYRQGLLPSRDSSSFSFKASVKKPVITANEVQLTGFSNLGNTCYMNAILQSLLGIDSFAQDLCNRILLNKISTYCLYKCTYGLLACKKNNCQQDVQSLHLKKFKKTISQAATRFSGHLQHDAHEFLCQVLDQLKDDVNALIPKSDSKSTSESPAKEEISNQCPVRRTFECEVMHTITCKGCEESLKKEEIYHVFSLDLPAISSDDNVSQVMKKLSIDNLIEDYFKEEELEYCCEECGFKEAVISHTFSRLPRVLILHLKRYDFNTYTDKHAKKQNDIQINRFIDIGKLCTSKTTPPLEFKFEKVKLSPVKTPRLAKRSQPDSQSDDDFVSATTPKIRRRLQQEFDTSPRERKVQIIDDDSTKDKVHTHIEGKQIKNGTGINLVTLINDFDEIDDSSLKIDTPKSDSTMPLLYMSEQQQIEWAKKESLRSPSSNAEQEECTDQYDTKSDREKTKGPTTCDNYSRKESKRSVSGRITGNIGGETKDMDGDMDVIMDCSDEDLLTACEETHQQESVRTVSADEDTGNLEARGLNGGTRIGHTDLKASTDEDTHEQDNVCKDKDIRSTEEVHGLKGGARIGHTDLKASTDEDTHEQDNVCKDKDIRSTEQVHGLKGGARIGHTKVSTPVRQVTYKDDDSEHSGLDTKKKISEDSSDTSLDEGGGIKKRLKDSSLCSLMDRRPVLSKFSGDLLIESDSSDDASGKNSKNKQFVKSVTSPFNAKFHPSFTHDKSYSASKYPVKSSPSSHINRSSPSTREHIKSYNRREVQDCRTKRHVVQPGFDDAEVAKAIQRSLDDQVPSSDDENVKKAIELSIQESKVDYFHDQQDNANDDRVYNVQQAGKTLSPHVDLQNNSIDSGYQGEEDPPVSYSYRLVSVVSHLGNKSFTGHYISDVYDCAKDEWTSYDDLTAVKVDEHQVRYGRSREGYIFFYSYKQCIEAVKGRSPKSKK